MQELFQRSVYAANYLLNTEHRYHRPGRCVLYFSTKEKQESGERSSHTPVATVSGRCVPCHSRPWWPFHNLRKRRHLQPSHATCSLILSFHDLDELLVTLLWSSTTVDLVMGIHLHGFLLCNATKLGHLRKITPQAA